VKEMEAKEKASSLPRPSVRIRLNDSSVLIAAFIVALPAMIFLTIMGLLDRSVA
jgi:hypothetical protein